MVVRRDDDRRRSSAKSWANDQSKVFERTSFKLPEGVEVLRFTQTGVVKVDFLPFLAGDNNPRADKGMEHFEREYEVHRIATADGVRNYCCRQKCFGQACAACDWLTKYGNSADPKLVKSLRTQKRHLWLVNDTPGSKRPSFKVFDANHWNKGRGFGEQMAVVINTLDDEEPFSLEKGMTAFLTVDEDVMEGGKKYFLVVRIDFRPRKHQYEQSMLKSKDWPCLDDMLIDPGYDKIKQLLTTGVSDDDDGDKDDVPPRQESRTARTPSRRDDDEEEDTKAKGGKDDDEEDQDDEPRRRTVTQPRNGSHRSSSRRQDDDDDLDDGFSDEDDSELENDPKPSGKNKR